MHKAQLSISMIGIAIIVLVTVAIVIGVLSGYLGRWTGQAGEITGKTCDESGGHLHPADQCPGTAHSTFLTSPTGHKPLLGYFEELPTGQVCCKDD